MVLGHCSIHIAEQNYAPARSAIETFADVAAELTRFIDEAYNTMWLYCALGHLNPVQFDEQQDRPTVKTAP